MNPDSESKDLVNFFTSIYTSYKIKLNSRTEAIRYVAPCLGCNIDVFASRSQLILSSWNISPSMSSSCFWLICTDSWSIWEPLVTMHSKVFSFCWSLVCSHSYTWLDCSSVWYYFGKRTDFVYGQQEQGLYFLSVFDWFGCLFG